MHLCVAIIPAVLVDFNGLHKLTIQPDDQPEFISTPSPLIPPVVILLVIIVVTSFMIAYCCICRGYYYRSNSTAIEFQGAAAVEACGLGREAIDSFPTLCYTEVKSRKIWNALECAVCLNEFEDGDMITLLPKCDHIFHPECIGAWLENHVTCPVCRSDLTKTAEEEIADNEDVTGCHDPMLTFGLSAGLSIGLISLGLLLMSL